MQVLRVVAACGEQTLYGTVATPFTDTHTHTHTHTSTPTQTNPHTHTHTHTHPTTCSFEAASSRSELQMKYTAWCVRIEYTRKRFV